MINSSINFSFQAQNQLKIGNLKPIPIGNAFVDFLNSDIELCFSKALKICNEMLNRDILAPELITRYYQELNASFFLDRPSYYNYFNGLFKPAFDNLIKVVNWMNDKNTSESDRALIIETYVNEIKKINDDIVYFFRSLSEYHLKFSAAAKICLDINNVVNENPLNLAYKNDISSFLNPNKLEFTGEFLTRINITYTINENSEIVTNFTTEDIYQMIYQEFFYMIRNNLLIRKCSNCGKYFTLSSRIDTVYCDNIFSDTGKTCKEIGAMLAYKQKVSENPALKEYNKSYQSKYAKLVKPYRTNPGLKKKQTELLKKWVYEAKNKLAQYEESKISLDDFINWLKEGE